MYARWSSFAVGLGLLLAPLLLGYGAVGPLLEDVAAGLLVCIVALAALERPSARYALALPAAWLIHAGTTAADAAARRAELAAGVVLLAQALLPSARLVRRLARGSRGADARV